jgi:hypothetical protein
MPTFRIGGYMFRFYSSDGVEPPHVHILRDSCEAKVWLNPVALQHNRGYTSRELGEVLRLCAANAATFLEAWNGYFGKFER